MVQDLRHTINRVRRSRRVASSKKSITTRKPTANTQKKQILSLATKVNKISKKVSNISYEVMHYKTISSSIVAPCQVLNINSPSFFSPNQCFSETTESRGAKYTGKGLTVDFILKPNTEQENVDCTIIFASPKNQKVVVECGGATSSTMETLIEDVDYVGLNGQYFMNKKRWHVHKTYKMATLPRIDPLTVGQQINPTVKNRRTYRSRNNIRINNRTGLWTEVDDWEINPNQRLQAFVFNNNATTLEGSPWIEVTCLFTGYCS